jgi:hypothetical protein
MGISDVCKLVNEDLFFGVAGKIRQQEKVLLMMNKPEMN